MDESRNKRLLKDDTQEAWDVDVATNKDFTEGITLIESVNSHENYVLPEIRMPHCSYGNQSLT